ncbi:MAG: ester cyclase [Chloroflexota bacterium]|nr:ester cyclase [Chloroflexota bacterium]
MSTEDNKAIIRRWVDAWNTQNVAAVDDFVTPDYVRHDPNVPEVRGPAAEKQLMTMFLSAFPDLHLTIEDLVAEGDRVVMRLMARGTHQGQLLGIPPTNRHIAISSLEIFRLAGGKITEQWVTMDALGMLQQLGAIPMPRQPGT